MKDQFTERVINNPPSYSFLTLYTVSVNKRPSVRTHREASENKSSAESFFKIYLNCFLLVNILLNQTSILAENMNAFNPV